MVLSNKEISIQVGAQIKYYRTLKKLSQESLALSAGLNPSFLGHIERGIKCPTIDTLNKIVSALDISLAELLTFDDNIQTTNNEQAIERIKLTIRNLPAQDADRIASIVEEISKVNK